MLSEKDLKRISMKRMFRPIKSIENKYKTVFLTTIGLTTYMCLIMRPSRHQNAYSGETSAWNFRVSCFPFISRFTLLAISLSSSFQPSLCYAQVNGLPLQISPSRCPVLSMPWRSQAFAFLFTSCSLCCYGRFEMMESLGITLEAKSSGPTWGIILHPRPIAV